MEQSEYQYTGATGAVSAAISRKVDPLLAGLGSMRERLPPRHATSESTCINCGERVCLGARLFIGRKVV